MPKFGRNGSYGPLPTLFPALLMGVSPHVEAPIFTLDGHSAVSGLCRFCLWWSEQPEHSRLPRCGGEIVRL